MTVIINGTTGITDVDGSAATPALTGTDTNTGIFFPAADTIAFAEGGTEAMRIDSSGNVGIGTASPSYKLDVRSSLAVLDGSSNIGFWANGATYTQVWQTLQSVNDFIIQTAASKYIAFGTNSTERMRIAADGVITSTLGGMQVISGTSVSASGTSVNFTSIPSWVKRITVQFIGVSGNGGSMPTVRLGDAGGIEATGYSGSTQTSGSAVLLSTGFDFAGTYQTAARVYHGAMTLTLQNSSTNTWAGTCMVGLSDGASVLLMGGTKSLSQTLDRISITFTNGTDSFDAGTINILYE